MTVEQRLDALCRKYGDVSVDYFPPDTWRIWFKAWHVHTYHFRKDTGEKRAGASYGGFVGTGNTLEEALDRVEKWLENTTPILGGSCREGCPHWGGDFD